MRKLIVFLILAVILTGCASNEATNQITSTSVLQSKFVGSRDTDGFSCDIEVYEDTKNLYNDSELVISGAVKSITEVSEDFNGETLYASKINVEVSEVIKGDSSIKSLHVLQTGKPDSDNYETKLKKDNKYILFLNSKTFNGETVYDCTGIEQGIFEVDEKGKLYSYVDFGVSATFDNKSTNELKQEIIK